MRTWLALLVLLSSSHASAQSFGDHTVRALDAAPVHRHGSAAAAPFVLHASGDLIVAAEGVLRTDPEGATRWYHADREVVDVASTPDGAIFGLSRFPFERPRAVRVTRFGDDGREAWSYVRRRVDSRTYPDITAAANGDVLLCATVHERGNDAVRIDRLGPRGELRWSRRVAFEGECAVIASDAADHIYWAGNVMLEGRQVAVVEKLDGAGAVLWSQPFSGYPLAEELAIGSDGAVILAGDFDGTQDLLPGPREHLATADGYTTFVTRFDAAGTPEWAWVGRISQTLAGVLTRGDTTLVIEAGTMAMLDASGAPISGDTFGVPVNDGIVSVPYLSLTGALLDARGDVVIVGGLPEPEYSGPVYHLFDERPYAGPRGSFLARPGW